jgi:hypothetical protein
MDMDPTDGSQFLPQADNVVPTKPNNGFQFLPTADAAIVPLSLNPRKYPTQLAGFAAG